MRSSTSARLKCRSISFRQWRPAGTPKRAASPSSTTSTSFLTSPERNHTDMAGKGFTVKKDWDSPKEHAMPEGVRVPADMRVGSVLVSPATILAPMAGVTDTVFRRFIRHASLFATGHDAPGEHG